MTYGLFVSASLLSPEQSEGLHKQMTIHENQLEAFEQVLKNVQNKLVITMSKKRIKGLEKDIKKPKQR